MKYVSILIAVTAVGIFGFSACGDDDTAGGSANNGTANNGTANNGTANNGTANNGTANNGTANNGTANNGSIRTRVYATLVSHNEQDNNPGCGPLYQDEGAWHANRALTLRFAQAIVDGGGAYDLQSDYRWIEQMDAWETDEERAQTGGMNLLEYLATAYPGQVVVDAHNHDSRNGGPNNAGINYADVQYMLQNRGVSDTGVVGGFLWYPADGADWERFAEPLPGLSWPDFQWQGQILWGGATRNHQGPDSPASGVWRPAGADRFHEDDPNATIVTVGKYDTTRFSDTQGVALGDLLAEVRAGDHPDDVMLTASFFVDQCGLTEESVTIVESFLETHRADVESGDLVWATVPDTVRIWRDEYGSRAYIAHAPEEDENNDLCEGGCPEGEICCLPPAPCAGRCVPDCNLTEMCPDGTVCQPDGICQ